MPSTVLTLNDLLVAALCYQKRFALNRYSVIGSGNFLFSPADLETAFIVLLPAHQQGQKIVVYTELLINLIQVGVLAFHKQVDLFLRHHHLQEVGFQAAGVVQEVDILVLR